MSDQRYTVARAVGGYRIYDGVIPLRGEEVCALLNSTATPDEISAAHPKCGSCGHCKLSPSGFDYCANEQSKLTHWVYVNPSTDYCPNHSELHVPQEGGEG